MKGIIVYILVLSLFLMNIGLNAQNARNPITNNSTSVNNYISSSYGPRLMPPKKGSKFHPSIDFTVRADL
ncbi:hypothetical protein [Alkalitalea saponilacus]|uniref:Uncharacterized protein n=1 Tax=Alkalitalea saponilacus TaxID=889453 RepID=A0A1T5A661_9BACT|nr:hypothetical protein [Alkalitalea saponilacus]ASB48834.1 hypothetical protein CDL62_06660 [Alkalitalea saponilacus]SKB30385.1 hypothetical protein SAMN03080601_00105 [Alkalitalea saponilacus]